MTDQQVERVARVKPLEWEDFEGQGAKASGFYQANYLITKWRGRGEFEVAMSYPGYQTGFDGERFHPTLEAAKAAAQADYETRILSAIAAMPAPTVQEWQPIETAPKDGTLIMLYANVVGWEDRGYSRCVGWFDGNSWSVFGPAFGEGGSKPSRQRPMGRQRIGVCQPTHWMPLPAPPLAEQEGE